MAQLPLNFGRGDTPVGEFGDFLSDVIYGSNLRPDLVETFYAHFAQSWFESVSAAYEAKSRGQVDETGTTWEGLSDRTKAYGRPDLRLGLSLPGPKARPTLTAAQDRRWRALFASRLSELQEDPAGRFYLQERQAVFGFLAEIRSEREAMNRAASYAWTEVKRRYGAQTLIGLLEKSQPRILVKSGRLAMSLAPARLSVSVPYVPREDQVFRSGPNLLVLGTSVEYASDQHETRPLWPKDYSLWSRRAAMAGLKGVRDAIS